MSTMGLCVRLFANPLIDVIPDAVGFRFVNRMAGTSLKATPLQASLISALFTTPSTLDDACAKEPRARRDRAFLDACVDAGVLITVDDAGRPQLPDLVAPEAPFMGAPPLSAVDAGQGDAVVAFIGIPWDRDVSGRSGARFGPWAVRSATSGSPYAVDPISRRPQGFFDLGLQARVLEGVDVVDAGDVLVLPGDAPQLVRDRMTRVVAQVCATGAVPLVVGGDHSITRPILAGVIDALRAAGDIDTPITILHFDAHTDLGDALENEQGRLSLHHGNVMTVVLEELSRVRGIVQVGLRGMLKANAHVADERVVAIGMDAIHADNHEEIVAKILAALPEDHFIWFSVDIDVVDPAFAPSTGTPVPGGMLPRELFRLLDRVARVRHCLGIDLVEVAEPHGPADTTAGVGATCLTRFCHAMVEGQRQRDAEDAAAQSTDDAPTVD